MTVATPLAPPEGRGAPEQHGRGAVHRPPSRRSLALGAVIALLVAGLALGRFVLLDGEGLTGAPPEAPSPAELVAALEAAVEADPDDLRAHQRLGAAYLRRAAETGDPSYHGLADRVLARAGELAPDDPENDILLGGLALGRHQFADALRHADAAGPDDPDALVVKVDAEIELGRYAAAGVTLDRLQGFRPDLAALARLSYFEQLHGNTARAVLTMQEAERSGGSPFARATAATFLGDLRLGAGDVARADEDYRRALDLAPRLVLAELGRARVLAAEGDRGGAVAALRRLTERYPLPAALILLGELHELDGREQEAAHAYQLARASFGSISSAGGVVDLEAALFEADHGEPARALELALAADAERSTVYTADAVAWALHRAGRDGDARPHVERALALGTADAVLRYHAAEVLAGAGDRIGAAEELASALATEAALSPFQRARAAGLAATLGLRP